MCDISRWTVLSLVPDELLEQLQSAIVFGSTGSELIFKTKDKIYASGSNVNCCLGTPASASLQPKPIESLSNINVVDFAFGAGPHVLALSQDGEIYSWGYNLYGQLGHGHSRQCTKPERVSGALGNLRVAQVACGGHHSVAVTVDGEVFSWGHNDSGQLGIGTTSNQDQPRRVSLHNRIVTSVCCGYDFTIALTRSGDVFAWGNNSMGQIGNGATCSQHTPYYLDALSKAGPVTQVACGYAHCLAMTDEGKLFVWGANSCGQLASQSLKAQWEPKEASFGCGRLVQIAASHSCNVSAVQTTTGEVLMWGLLRGQTVCSPITTPFTSVDDVFACFASPTISWRCLRRKAQKKNGVIDVLRSVLDDPHTSDVKLHVDGRMLHAHRSLLVVRSAYLRARLNGPWAENDGPVGEIEIKDFPFAVVRAYLRYLYTDVVEQEDLTLVVGLLELANCYCEDELRQICAAHLQRQICILNAAQLYQTAIRLSITELEEAAFQFCLNHMTAITQSEGFRDLDELALKRLISRASKEGIFKR